jgi:acetyl-CoA carboxylase carboxyltransferase component
LRIAITNGYCFAGNAALFGASDIRIATKGSNIGMAGPAMIEGGGLGKFSPDDIGAVEDHLLNGVVDVLVENEEQATNIAKKILSYFQGSVDRFDSLDQELLKNILPNDRRFSYEIRDVIEIVADLDSFIELKKGYGRSLVTGFIRVEGIAFGLLASDCKFLGGAIDSDSADKAAEFFEFCNDQGLPMVSLVDTPGFMVGPDSEKEGAPRRMGRLFKSSSTFKNNLVSIFLRKGYGLGAQAIVGGSLHKSTYTCAWPSGEFGGMGLEGAVKLGYKKELEAISDPKEKEILYSKLVDKMYEAGQAMEAASFLEIDAVIDPSKTRETIIKAQHSPK